MYLSNELFLVLSVSLTAAEGIEENISTCTPTLSTNFPSPMKSPCQTELAARENN